MKTVKIIIPENKELINQVFESVCPTSHFSPQYEKILFNLFNDFYNHESIYIESVIENFSEVEILESVEVIVYMNAALLSAKTKIIKELQRIHGYVEQ